MTALSYRPLVLEQTPLPDVPEMEEEELPVAFQHMPLPVAPGTKQGLLPAAAALQKIHLFIHAVGADAAACSAEDSQPFL